MSQTPARASVHAEGPLPQRQPPLSPLQQARTAMAAQRTITERVEAPGGPQVQAVVPRLDSQLAVSSVTPPAVAAASVAPRKLTNPTPTLIGPWRAIAAWIGIDGVVRPWEPFVATIETMDDPTMLMLSGFSSVEVPASIDDAQPGQMQPQRESLRTPKCITGTINTSELTASIAITNRYGPPEQEWFLGTIEHPEGGADREWQLKLRRGPGVLCGITLKPESPASGSSSSSSTPILSALESVSANSTQPQAEQMAGRTRSNSDPSSHKH